MRFRSVPAIAALALSCVALAGAAPAAAQLVAGEKETAVPALPGITGAGAKWERVWQGPMTADGITASPDGALLFAQEQSNSIRKLWPDGREWVQWPYIAGAGAVSIDATGRTFAVERTCTDPGLGLGQNCNVMTRVIQLTPERKVLAQSFADGKTLGRLNDVAADGYGGAFFTQQGIYHVAADGTVDVVAEGGGMFTNGLVLSPDGKTLYVTNRGTIVAFDVGANGATSNRRDFATLNSEAQGSFGADGLAVDNDGRLYATAGAGVYVFDKAGKSIGLIPTPRLPITIAFAGPDRRKLYIGAMGAADPDGKAWATPEGVRNVAMTLYSLDTLAAGPAGRPK